MRTEVDNMPEEMLVYGTKRDYKSVKRVTVDQVMTWDPCPRYPRSRIKDLFAGRESLSAGDILRLDIHPKDRLWAVMREDMMPAGEIHNLACWFAEQCLLREREAGREPDAYSWAAIEVKRRWVQGRAADEELEAANMAAWEVAYKTARATVTQTTWAARDAATRAATRAAWAASAGAQEAVFGASAWDMVSMEAIINHLLNGIA